MQFEGLPDSFRTDIEQAIEVSGLPKDRFFTAYGQLLVKMVHEVDLVDLDDDAAFVHLLKESGKLERVA